jgi:acyl carrier protein
VASVARVPADRLTETTSLVQDLGLASLDLVELAAAFEEEFGASLQEDVLAGATIGDLERAAQAAIEGASDPASAAASAKASPVPASPGAAAPGPASSGSASSATAPASADTPPREAAVARAGELRMPRWARRLPLHFLRRIIEELVQRPIVFLFGRPRISGLENLALAAPPYLIVANHLSYLDTALIKSALSLRLRGRIAPGMTTRYQRVFFGEISGSRGRYLIEWMQATMAAFFFHAWPVPETAGFRRSVAYAGELADAGFTILLFPEGRHVPVGTTEPFRGGVGVLARELRAPVIPAYVEGTAEVLPDHAWIPRFGRTRLVLGPPIHVDPNGEATEITRRLEAAVRALGGKPSA